MARATRSRTKGKTKSTTKEKPPVPYMEAGEVVEPSDNFLDYCILIYGESGIGKTSLCSKIPGAYIVQLDPNRASLKVRQTNVPNLTVDEMVRNRPDYTPWEMVTELLERACEDKSVSTIVIDNFGLLYEHCLRDVCFKDQLSDPTEANDFGQTWRKIENQLTHALNKVIEAGRGLVLITHDTEKEVEMPDGSTFERIEPAVMKAGMKWLKACTDFAFYMGYADDGGRVLNLRGDKEIWLKCCVDEDSQHFFSPEGTPVRQISCGTSPTQAWKNLCQSWENKLHDVNHKTKESKGRSRRKTRKND